MSIASLFASAWRDYVTDGVPASGPNEPAKSEIRAIGASIDSALASLSLASVSVTKDTAPHLAADLAHADGTTALVYADPTGTNNDIWLKSGASGSGSWTNTGILHSVITGAAQPSLDIVAAGAATAVGAANSASASASAAASAALPMYATAVKSAIGNGSLKCLFDMDGPRTNYSATFTVTIASPGVITSTAHNLNNGDIVFLSTTGALPTGYTAGVGYYVVNRATNTYQLSLTLGGTAINTTGSQSGTHTAKLASTIMTGLASLDDTPLNLSLHSTLFSGPDERPVYVAGRGVYLSSQAGWTLSNGLLSKTTGDWAILYACDLNTLTSTVALKASLPGSPIDGDVTLVNGDTNLTPALIAASGGVDIISTLDQIINDADMVNGLWHYSASPTPGWFGTGCFLFNLAGAASFIRLRVVHNGQLFFDYYTGSGAILGPHTVGSVPYGQGKLLLALRRYRNAINIYLNGRMLGTIDATGTANVTDFATLLVNGNGRSANALQPISAGIRHYMKGLIVADDLTDMAFTRLHDVMANRFATPEIR